MASSSQAVVHNIEPRWIEMLSVTKDTPAKHTGTCGLCGRQTDQITTHRPHLYPRATVRKAAKSRFPFTLEQKESVAAMCWPCHCIVHRLISADILAASFHSIDLLRTHSGTVLGRFWYDISQLWTGTFFYGIYLVLFCICICILLNRPRPGNTFYLVTAIALFTLSTAQAVLNLVLANLIYGVNNIIADALVGIAPTLIIVRVGLGVKTLPTESTLKMADVMASDGSRFSQPDLEKGLPGTPRDVEKGFSNYDAVV
ncbi:hypothetical protein DFH08DRAFT_967877 [Mycena albidolilacea]|uniref:Uncharacterized protein n=1 Tax=Mycena albidolilacea TaxID=1033008 RepID=A0AAD6ZKM3_9AGAR|nr:hypothetical protein DFH08DRAFT_967877 [Mycena albidolilacea]